MKVILLGATGMVGQGVLRECLRDPRVTRVLTVGRQRTGLIDPRLTELVPPDLFDLTTVADQVTGYDACFFCLGVSAAGLSEAAYRRLTYDLTLSIAGVLAGRNPGMTFTYVSGQGTDSTEHGRTMWARVKGATENALQRLPFKAVYLFQPGYIQPLDGIQSKTRLYRAIYAVLGPAYPVMKALFPGAVTTTRAVGRAMIALAIGQQPSKTLTNRDINAVAASAAQE